MQGIAPMIYIKHRVNNSAALPTLDQAWGVEIDLRSSVKSKNKLHLSHDPWVLGEDFETWLDKFSFAGLKGPLILNTKEDGLEARAREILAERKVDNYLFLDTTVPSLVKWTTSGESRFMCRVSSYESLSNAQLSSRALTGSG
jgi:hypothetical protein